MKTIFIFICCLLVVTNGFCQSSENYQQKAKRQRNVGWTLLGAGSVIATVGIFVSNSNRSENDLGYGSNFDIGAWMFVTGVAADLVSVPFFISSSVNANRVAVIALKNEHLQSRNMVKYYPAISLRLKLNTKHHN